MPERIQLRRTKGWRKPEGAVVVARPSKWGNPFTPGQECSIATEGLDGLWYEYNCVLTLSQCVEMYRADKLALLRNAEDDEPEDRQFLADLAELRGRDLACWCPLAEPCHADVLLELANRP